MRALIFANGDLNQPEKVRESLLTGDLLIAVDGGARHCAQLGLLPHVAIGDFDSLTSAELDSLRDQGVQVMRFAARKDFTDLELALRHAIMLGCNPLWVFGALGARWDHTMANVLLLASPDLAGVDIRLVDGNQEIALLRPGQDASFSGQPGDTLSLLPLAGDAHGIVTQGLEYPLNGETLHFGATRGVSNVLTGTDARLSFEKGLLLCTLIHRA